MSYVALFCNLIINLSSELDLHTELHKSRVNFSACQKQFYCFCIHSSYHPLIGFLSCLVQLMSFYFFIFKLAVEFLSYNYRLFMLLSLVKYKCLYVLPILTYLAVITDLFSIGGDRRICFADSTSSSSSGCCFETPSPDSACRSDFICEFMIKLKNPCIDSFCRFNFTIRRNQLFLSSMSKQFLLVKEIH